MVTFEYKSEYLEYANLISAWKLEAILFIQSAENGVEVAIVKSASGNAEKIGEFNRNTFILNHLKGKQSN